MWNQDNQLFAGGVAIDAQHTDGGRGWLGRVGGGCDYQFWQKFVVGALAASTALAGPRTARIDRWRRTAARQTGRNCRRRRMFPMPRFRDPRMSPVGTTRTFADARTMSDIEGKSDIRPRAPKVRD